VFVSGKLLHPKMFVGNVRPTPDGHMTFNIKILNIRTRSVIILNAKCFVLSAFFVVLSVIILSVVLLIDIMLSVIL
jgi:hypothetical protein